MESKSRHRLGDLQLAILKILWRMKEATVAQVHAELHPSLAYTTVATMLRKMEARGLVRHEADGRKFVYRAAVDANELTGSAAGDFVDRFFAGSLSLLVRQLLETREISRSELRELEKLIKERKDQP